MGDRQMNLEEIQYIEIEKSLIPYSFTYDYKGKIFEMEIRYNAEYDFFTIDLYVVENEMRTALILGEKIMYAQMLFSSIYYKNVDTPPLLPWDFSGNSIRVGHNEIDNVYLVVMEDEALE